MKKKFLLSACSLVLAGILLFLSVSCGQREIVINETDLLQEYLGSQEAGTLPLKAQETKGTELTAAFQKKMAQFAFSLLNKTMLATGQGENQLLSPLSAMYCLALIVNGAGEKTRAQMSEVLGMEPEELNPSLLAYMLGLSDTADAKMKMANSVWFRNVESLQIKESFLKTVADWYQAQIYTSDFDEETVKNINAWCEKYTNGMIKKIIEDIGTSSMLYLINALVFDAKWQTEYEDNQVREGKFTNVKGEKETVTFLDSTEGIYLESQAFEGVVKYYKGGDYAFVGLLPKTGTDAAALAETLTGEDWLAAWNNRSYETVYTKIPEFKTEASIELTDLLKAMGMTDAFNAGAADFLPMGTYNGGSLYLSGVYQKTYLELDRNGTKAAAVTWGEMKATSIGPAEDPKYIYLDRPFVYMIVDTQYGIPSFIGVAESMK